MAEAAEEMFDSILLADERFRGEGFQEGFQTGTHRGLRDGRRHGASHGALMASEISFYGGFAETWRCLLQENLDDKTRKRLKVLEVLLGLVQTFPLQDPQSVNLQDDTEKLRSKFRQVCSMLNVPADFKDLMKTADRTSF